MWHIRLPQDLARPLCLGLSLLLCPMLTQQPSVLLPLFVATLFSACLFVCFLLASRLALLMAIIVHSVYITKPCPHSLFRMMQMCCCFVAWWRLVLEMVSGQYTFSIFLRQVLWKHKLTHPWRKLDFTVNLVLSFRHYRRNSCRRSG